MGVIEVNSNITRHVPDYGHFGISLFQLNVRGIWRTNMEQNLTHPTTFSVEI
jgi:hypothetical protein